MASEVSEKGRKEVEKGENSMEWKFREGVPIYSQIVEHLKVCIARGELGPGDKIASVRELAASARVNPNTMQKALAELEREGLVHSERTSGRFVTDDTETIRRLRQALGRKFIKDFFEKLDMLGMDKSEIIRLVTEWNERENEE